MKFLKKIGRTFAGAAKGIVHGLLPIDDFRSVLKNPDRKAAAEKLRSAVGGDGRGFGRKELLWIADLLDDGKINNSVDDARIETISRLIASASGLIALLVYLLMRWL